jgi:putative membrane protein
VNGDRREPDYRFSLANERTLLAWVRTALALDAAGLGVVRFAPPLGGAFGRAAIGGVLVLLGAVSAWIGHRRFLATDRAMRAGAPFPSTPPPGTWPPPWPRCRWSSSCSWLSTRPAEQRLAGAGSSREGLVAGTVAVRASAGGRPPGW